MNEECFVGVDVSKAWLDVAQVCSEEVGVPRRVANDEAGRGSLCAAMVQLKPTLIVMEASGGFEMATATQLCAAGLVVAVVNPKRVRDFAKAAGVLANTTASSRSVLARFA